MKRNTLKEYIKEYIKTHTTRQNRTPTIEISRVSGGRGKSTIYRNLVQIWKMATRDTIIAIISEGTTNV